MKRYSLIPMEFSPFPALFSFLEFRLKKNMENSYSEYLVIAEFGSQAKDVNSLFLSVAVRMKHSLRSWEIHN